MKSTPLAFALLAVPDSATPCATHDGKPQKPKTRSSGPSLEQLVGQVQWRYRAVRTLQAAFTQTYVWGGKTRVESGTAYFARGGLMRWDYREPKEKLVVSDGKKLWLYIPEENQVTRS